MTANDAKTISEMLDDLTAQLGKETIVELIEVFENNSTSQLGKIRAALSNSDFRTIQYESHSLKSSSANMGALLLSKLCLDLEKQSAIQPTTAAQIESITQAHTAALGFMHDWRKR